MVIDYCNHLNPGDRYGKLNTLSGFSVHDHDYFVISMQNKFNIVVFLCIINRIVNKGKPIVCCYIT